ncbi:MAG TPA: hypothetical protein VK469_20745, partial [Candidatus Kapabacteria bacterium]|nr:hypothetical protein [Candidatus Kapabacteria bacterium]
METFATQLTHLFIRPYLPESRFDRVCRLVCKNVGASCASILMYAGREDEIHCKGRYIDPEIGKISIANNPVLMDIMRQICAHEFLYAAEEKISVEKAEDLYNDYKEDEIPGEAISSEDFSRLLRDIGDWKEGYKKLQEVYQDEKYPIHIDTKWLSGKWFKSLLKKGKTYSPEVLIKNLDEVGAEEKIFCLETLENMLGLRFSAKFYVALPLFAIGRYFGVLR